MTQSPVPDIPTAEATSPTANVTDSSAIAERSTNRGDDDLPDLLQRPEAVILILVTFAVFVWQLYLSLIEERESANLSGSQLSRRLGVDRSTISRRKSRRDFSIWSQKLDPDGIAWSYQDGLFVPQVAELKPTESS